mmetsp:Transcript_41715/g.90960  ORF Transcript_41715/g.90960 Transcript_41715/m.90960 type:complete len:188 (+) Transcript_41715:1323-1886(+)
MNNDSQLASIHKNDNNKSLNIYDLETEKLISSFDTKCNLKDIHSNIKNGPVNEGNTIYAISDNGYHHYDPRIKNMQVCENTYKTVHGLNSIASTNDGTFAVSSSDGHVRLYTNITQKRAKTDLVGFGDPILELDVCKSGDWVLGTCESYLMLIPTVLDENKNGFTHRMGKDKPLPIKLTLNHSDLVK